MTSTNQCIIGLGKKNSSRVLRPPGGGSSFSLFGNTPEETKPSKTVNVEVTNSATCAVAVTSVENNSDGTSNNEESTDLSNPTDASGLALISEEREASAIEVSDVVEEPNEENSTNGEMQEVEKLKVEVKPEELTRVEGVEKNQVPESQPDKTSKGKAPNQAYNPITGEAYASTNTTDSDARKATNIRVRQPPGGASTKLW